MKHPGNPKFGEPGFRQGSSNTGFRGCGPRVRIYALDYAIGSGQGQGCGTTIFKKPSQSSGNPNLGEPGFWQGSGNRQGSGNNPRVGYTPWVVPRFMLRTGSQKTTFEETKVPGLTGGGSGRDNKSACLGSGNPGFQYTLWVVPRFRKRGFQEHKVPDRPWAAQRSGNVGSGNLSSEKPRSVCQFVFTSFCLSFGASPDLSDLRQ